MPLPLSANDIDVPGDTREQRARRVAWAYRRQLEASNPEACRALDAIMYECQEYWVHDQRPLDPDELLSAPDLASLLAIEPNDLRNWSKRGHIGKYSADDGSPVYLTGEVVSYMARRHAARAAKSGR